MAMIILSLLVSIISTAANHRGGMLLRFRNIADHDITLWWITPYSNEELRFFGHLQKNGGMVSFTANPGSRFLWAPPDQVRIISKRTPPFTITHNKILYLYTDENHPAHPQIIAKTNQELKFLSNYYSKYNRHWLSTYNRPNPIVPFVTLKSNEKTKWIESNSYFWKCTPLKVQQDPITETPTIANRISRLFTGSSNQIDKISSCQDNNKGNKLKFIVEKLHNDNPVVYKISNFISPFEAKHIIDLSLSSMHRSTTGGGRNVQTDPTRTSTNTWLAMNRTKVIETIYKRVAHVLGIDAYKMTVEANVIDQGVSSHMEVIHFDTNQFYARHFDNAVEESIFLRFITFQVILRMSDNFVGGTTSFIEAEDNGKTTRFSVKSEEYCAVFWYNVLNDGNLDATAMYSNDKVRSGDQWMFHITIWDPSLPVGGDPSMPNELMYAKHDEL